MPLPLSERNPTLITAVDEAYERTHRAAGETARELGGTAFSLAAHLEQDAAAIRARNAVNELEMITDHDARMSLLHAFACSEEIYAKKEYLRIREIPQPEDFVAAGVDFGALAERLAALQHKGFIPTVLVAPRLRRYPTTRLIKEYLPLPFMKNGSVHFSGVRTDLIDNVAWEDLNKLDRSQPHLTMPDGTTWSIALQIETSAAEPLPDDIEQQYASPLSISQYAHLQLLNISTGHPPADTTAHCRLRGSIPVDDFGPRLLTGHWDSESGCLVIGLRRDYEIHAQKARHAIWS